jgi:hypothetical protein
MQEEPCGDENGWLAERPNCRVRQSGTNDFQYSPALCVRFSGRSRVAALSNADHWLAQTMVKVLTVGASVKIPTILPIAGI